MAPKAPRTRQDGHLIRRGGVSEFSMKSVRREGRVQFESGFGEGVKS